MELYRKNEFFPILPFSGFVLPFSGLLCLFPGAIHNYANKVLGRFNRVCQDLFWQINPEDGRMGTTKALAAIENYDADSLEREPGNRWVTMSNALTRAGHGLTLSEKRLVMASVSKLNSVRNPRPGECPVIKITAAEYAENWGVDANTAYEQLQDGAKNLYNRSILFYEPSFTRKGKPIMVTNTMRWVGQVKYHKNDGWVELHFWHAIVPHLMGIKKNFTSYQLQQASALRSVYSWRLLELLTRFESTGWAEYSIEDFAVSMNATEKQKSDFAAIRRKMIEPAVKELQEKDGWLIQWMPIKTGRKVSGVRFNFMRNPQGSLPL